MIDLRKCPKFFLLSACLSQNLHSEEMNMTQSITGKTLRQHIGLDKFNIDTGGWLTIGYSYNLWHPIDRNNGTVQFNQRANEFNLYQLGLFADKPVNKILDEWQLGGRFEFMFGTDTQNTQAAGHWDSRLIGAKDLRFYDIALPQAYLEVFAPLGRGVSAKIGHFCSILGYESVPSPPNLFVSHSYSMKSSPFTMSGLLLTYPVSDEITLQSGAVTGPDNLDSHADAWSYLGGMTWENTKHSTGFTFSVLNGDIDDTQPSNLLYYYAMLHHDLSPKLRVVLQHDFGRQQNAIGSRTAEWYSIVNYWNYDISHQWNAGIRAEWFHDDDGTRFLTIPGSYYDISIAANWKPLSWLTLRPEIRYDWADGIKPFDTGRKENQWLLEFDAVIRF